MRKTKIICTIGPASESEEMLEKLMKAGMDVARFNFSHGTHEEHEAKFNRVVKIRRELNLPVATLLDTKGPEIRLGDFKDGKVMLEKGQKFTLTTKQVEGDREQAFVNYQDLPKDVKKGGCILIDDMQRNVRDWNAMGGTGILFVSAEETIKRLREMNVIS